MRIPANNKSELIKEKGFVILTIIVHLIFCKLDVQFSWQVIDMQFLCKCYLLKFMQNGF